MIDLAPDAHAPTLLEELAPGIGVLADLLGDRVVTVDGNYVLERAHHRIWGRTEGRLTPHRAAFAEDRLRPFVERALRSRSARTPLSRALELVGILRTAPYRADHVLEVRSDAMDCGHLCQVFVNDWQGTVSVSGWPSGTVYASGPTRQTCLDRLEAQLHALGSAGRASTAAPRYTSRIARAG